MQSKRELIKEKKSTILLIVTVILALVFLGGSQAISKRPPAPPSVHHYCADVTSDTGDIDGEGLVGMKRGVITSRLEVGFPLYFDEEIFNNEIAEDFGGEHCGWLDVGFLKPSGKGSFYYSWDQGDVRYSLSGSGDYVYNKKEGSLFFTSQGEEYVIHNIGWPMETHWFGPLYFQIHIFSSDECGEPGCF